MTAFFRTRVLAGALACSIGFPLALAAQSASYRVEPSGRATTAVSLTRVGAAAGSERPAPAKIMIDYGQPHLRGRDVLTLMPLGTEWRLGANTSTSITTDLDLVIGGASVPKGTYTLWTIRSATGTKLIINKQTGQWGTSYNAAQDLARVDMRTKRLTQPLEALQITLVPLQNGPSGVLRVVWGTVELETDWSVKQ
jgi:hypothetical protein